MAKLPDQSAPIPTSAPMNFDRLFVQGEEILPGQSKGDGKPSKKIKNIKPINVKGDVDPVFVAKCFNLLLTELQNAEFMEDK
jgi:hypothetical protein